MNNYDSSNTPVNARYLAWNCLQRWGRGNVFAESLIDQAARQHKLSPADRALLQSILYGTLRQKSWLEEICYTLRPEHIEDELFSLLLTALCQLFVLNLAEYAVVNESVNMAPQRARGLVNGILRSALRNKEAILAQRETLPLHIRYSTPEWLVKRWVAEFGAEDTESTLRWNLSTPPLYARVNPLNPPPAIPSEWEELTELPGWYLVKGGLPSDILMAGQIYITDPSTRHSVRLLDPKPGEKVLDACAAPGGKAIAIVGATQGQVKLLATDVQAHRLSPLRENLMRAGAKDVHVATQDWTRACPEEWLGSFDAILLDLPCSNSGVLQRRVDARWRIKPEELERLADLQLLITQQAAAALRPGGRLVYSTCSIDRAENQDNIARFLKKNPEFTLVEDHLSLPHREKSDGTYAALLQRQ